MSDSIICTGNDLDQVCADIEARGGRVESLDTAVGGKNGNYRVNYFERVGATEVRGTPLVGQNPSALTNFDGEDRSTRSRRNDSRKAVVHEQPKNVISPVVAGEHAVNLSIEDRLQRLHATLKESGKLRRGKPSTSHHHARTPYKD